MLQACLVSAQPITTNKHTTFTRYFFSCFCFNSFLILLSMIVALFFDYWFATFFAIRSVILSSVWFVTLLMKQIQFLDLSACATLLCLHLITLYSDTPLSRFTRSPTRRLVVSGVPLWLAVFWSKKRQNRGREVFLLQRKKIIGPEILSCKDFIIFTKLLSKLCVFSALQQSTCGMYLVWQPYVRVCTCMS